MKNSPTLIALSATGPLAFASIALCAILAAPHDASAQRRGGASFEGARGGSISAEGESYGRYRSGSVQAEGPRGGTYDASGTQVGRYGAGSVSATGADGRSYSASGESFSGYRSGYVYSGGVYRPASVTANALYVAPVGVYAGLNVYTQPYYVTYPVYATYPVETAVQVQLARQGFYTSDIDGIVDKATSKAISKYQAANGLAITGTINKALLVSLGVIQP